MSWLTIGPVELAALRLSLWVAVVAVALSLPVAVAVAYALARCRFWGHGLLNALVHLPLVLPPVVTGYLLLVVFGRKGTFGPVLEALGIQLAFTSAGAALAAAVMAFPLIVRAIRLALEAVDPRLEEAAGTLGASPIKVFAFVTLPLIFRVSLLGPWSDLPRLWENSGRLLPSSPTSPAKRKLWPRPFTLCCKCRVKRRRWGG